MTSFIEEIVAAWRNDPGAAAPIPTPTPENKVMITPRGFLVDVVSRWEGGYQSYVDDLGNYVTCPDGSRKRVGTMRGVTPAALAAHRGVQACTLTPEDMQTVSLDEAADIGLKHYYSEPGLDKLVWGPATASVLDFGWVSGPGQAVLSTQRLIGVGADGIIGPVTAKAYAVWEADLGWTKATGAIHDMRAKFYQHLADVNPVYAQYLQGWLNRDNWASASNEAWWKQWGVVT